MSIYKTNHIQTPRDLDNLLAPIAQPVLLVEGTRSVPDNAEKIISAAGIFLAKRYPNAIFRTGNASGTDTIFAEVISQVDAKRLQYVLPNEGMGKARRHSDALSVDLTQLDRVAEDNIGRLTVDATARTERLVDAHKGIVANRRLAAKGAYLMRDTLKVAGAPEAGLSPASVGIFFAKDGDPMAGGTGHTIRVCMKNHVPVILQNVWSTWV